MPLNILRAHNIPYQLDVSDGGTTDATAISLTREGIPSGVLSMATRYICSPVELLSLSDMKACADLIVHAVGTVRKWFEIIRTTVKRR